MLARVRLRAERALRRSRPVFEDRAVPLALVRATAVVTGLLFGVGFGIAAADGHFAAIVVGVISILALGWVLVRIGRADSVLGALILLSSALHFAVATVLLAGSVAIGKEGFITGDDAEYFYLSYAFISWLNGVDLPPRVPPFWAGHEYLFGTFVYLEAVLIGALGPDRLIVPFLNGGVHSLVGILLFDIGRRMFGEVTGLLASAVVLFFPSLVIWSSLNLKDALALLLGMSVLWAILRFQLRPRWQILILPYVSLVALESLRPYLFFGLAVLTPVGVALAGGQRAIDRLRSVGATAVLSLVLIVVNQTVPLGTGVISTFERAREGMGLYARTSYVDWPTYVTEGMTFVVEPTVPPPSTAPVAVTAVPQVPAPPTPMPTPTPAPRVVNVPPNARIVIDRGSQLESIDAGVIVVRPGDVVVVGSATPGSNVRSLSLTDGRARFQEATSDEGLILARTIAYLPTGLAHAMLAPFPWALRRPVEWLTIPEMLLWYLSIMLAGATLWRSRALWRYLTIPALYVLGLVLLFAMVEGNVGTAYRHRGMLSPLVLLLAADSFRPVLGWLSAWPHRNARQA